MRRARSEGKFTTGKAKKELTNKVRVMMVKMKCCRCQSITQMLIPVGGHPACPKCGRPWFWPFIPICKENEAWAKEYIAKVESTFKPLLAPIPIREIMEKAGEIDKAYKEFVGVFDHRRTL